MQPNQKRPRLLVLGRGARRTTTGLTPTVLEERPSKTPRPGDTRFRSLYQASLQHLGTQIVRHPALLDTLVEKLSLAHLIALLPLITDALSAEQLVRLETCYPTLRRYTGAAWERLCQEIQAQLGNALHHGAQESWPDFYARLLAERDDRLRLIGIKVRQSYREEAPSRMTKLVGPRRNVVTIGDRPSSTAIEEPFASIRANSSLMKKSKAETLSLSKGSIPSKPIAPRMFLPKNKRP